MAPQNPIERAQTASKHLQLPGSTSDNEDNISVSSATPLTDNSGLTPEVLTELHDPKSLRKLHELGGIKLLLYGLETNLLSGIDTHRDLKHREELFGENRIPVKAQKNFFRLCYDAMKDKVLIMLTVAAVISLALGLYETFGEGPLWDDEGKVLPNVDWV